MPTVSFVIPVYNNQETLRPTYEQITALFDDELSGFDYEFVFVNDGSEDDSLKTLLDLREEDKKVRVFKLSRNFGQRSAVLCGFNNAEGDVIVKMSADLQEPIDIIPQMVKEWERDSEIVICYRQEREDSYIDTFFSNLFYGILRISNPGIPKGGFDFYLLGRRALDNLNNIDYRNRFIQGDVLWLGFRVKYLPYKRLQRAAGESQNTLAKRIKFFIDGVLSSTYLPIRFISMTGIIISLIGIIYSLVIIYHKLTVGPPYTGWSSLMVINLVIGGLVMFMLGIIGEYIWRVHDELKKRPDYIVDKKFDTQENDKSSS